MAEPGTYKKLQIKQFPVRGLRETAEGRYWRGFESPQVVQQVGGVTHVDFMQESPYDFAITSSTRVFLYNGKTKKMKKQFTRFKDKAYSGCLRSDGKVIAAGGETGLVQVFDAGSRSVLRQLEGHTRPVHTVKFGTDKLHVFSGGDDATARWWDVATGAQLTRLDGHSDYIRAAAASPVGPEMWATGGYDHTCNLWDVRSGGSTVLSVNHGAPIEDVAFFPSGSLMATAGGTSVCIWDVLGGGKLLRRVTSHQKTVTCVKIIADIGPPSLLGGEDAPNASTRMITGSLDGHLKIYDLDKFQVCHASKYPGPILSLGLSGDCGTMAVGLANGILSIRNRKKPRDTVLDLSGDPAAPSRAVRRRRVPSMNTGAYRYFMRGQGAKAGASDFKVTAQRRAKLAVFDKKLRTFHKAEALDAALATGQPEVVVSVLEELAAMGCMQDAIAGRDAFGLAPLLSFLCRFLTEPRYVRLLLTVAQQMLDVYGGVVGQAPAVDEKLRLLKERINVELLAQQDLFAVQGMLDTLLAGSMR
ncbi:hypothetical protein CYMTET_22303 [Cymbomonas tetramitiformis]|uniref:U3 small nucleolar RNA-associated protein 15 C-terminal domain-containing protein n=1 Tax=Cymbomonas tetramitiformis TaxID=36881 RepID=A0AAE0L240_9CHLO|nr:hypothetical protein CYMTET_22303 [Cymbomonas tetramitiformis]